MKLPPLKGKTLNEKLFDPRAFHFSLKQQFNERSKQEFEGSAPNIFVGRFNYPNVRVGLLTAQFDGPHDSPKLWREKKAPLKSIIALRTELVNAGGLSHVKQPVSNSSLKLKELVEEVALSSKPAELEVGLEKKPQFRLVMHKEVLPHGPKERLRRAKITSNLKVPLIVDRIHGDPYLKAGESLNTLRVKGFDEHYLSKLLSGGALGTKLERKLVPTRWSITAVDDVLGNNIRKKIGDYPETDFKVFFGGYMGNYYLLLFFPQHWSYELFENYAGARKINSSLIEHSDYEGVKGRKYYAERTAGGYYASRLAVLEYLERKRRKAGVIALRFITDEYWAPLGVWVVREATRAALESEPIVFGSEELMINYARSFVKKKFGLDIKEIFLNSRLLKERKEQTTLSKFF